MPSDADDAAQAVQLGPVRNRLTGSMRIVCRCGVEHAFGYDVVVVNEQISTWGVDLPCGRSLTYSAALILGATSLPTPSDCDYVIAAHAGGHH